MKKLTLVLVVTALCSGCLAPYDMSMLYYQQPPVNYYWNDYHYTGHHYNQVHYHSYPRPHGVFPHPKNHIGHPRRRK